MIINLTQHKATPEQVVTGVVDLEESAREILAELLTFDRIPSAEGIGDVAEQIALLADAHVEEEPDQKAMIGGAPYLMASLELALRQHRISPVYAFSRRESVEQTQADGSVRKINIFKHAGFVTPPEPEVGE